MLGSEDKGTGVKTKGSNSVQVCLMVYIAQFKGYVLVTLCNIFIET